MECIYHEWNVVEYEYNSKGNKIGAVIICSKCGKMRRIDIE